MKRAVIVDAVRTPIGRYRGGLKDVRPDDLLALALRRLVERTGVDPAAVEDVVAGAANQSGEDNRNVARMAALLAKFPETVAGQTVNRLCASGLQAVVTAAQTIQLGNGDFVIAGGVESMSRAPYVMGKPDQAYPRGDQQLQDTTLGWRFVNPNLAEMYPPISMGETAENLVDEYNISRESQDRFALASQQKALAAIAEGRFRDEITPVEVPQRRGPAVVVDTDEHPRPDTTLEKLGELRPAFRAGGSVTAGNSAGINDGAAAVLLASEETARKHGMRPLARLVSSAVVGVNPQTMGIGPAPATEKALQRAGLTLDDIDVIELNEAFAAQCLAVTRALGLADDDERINPNGGAIALGHPLGCSGARIVTTMVHEMARREARYGLATMCIGVGQGMAAIFERV